MNDLLDTTNLILIVGFCVLIYMFWLLLGMCVSINGHLEELTYIRSSLNEINERLRRKGLYKDSDEQNHSQFME
ncbi:hypothetical protein DPM18_08110 [Polynucleobacter paneuropaeus]|jgi:hypothetical protein|nr:hypothetical protein DPM18_08110 [Polynucleobacter paneuropaeus]